MPSEQRQVLGWNLKTRPERILGMKFLLPLSASIALLALASCGSSGQLAFPEQNIAARFELEGSFRRSWQWTEAGAPVILSLEEHGSHELLWCIRKKPRADRRFASISSLLFTPAFAAQGPSGLEQVRFSPSGTTILAHERSRNGDKFQTLLFTQDLRTGTWFSRRLDLGTPAKTKLKRLDDKTKVPVILSNSVPPQILRLDDDLVVYQIGKETRSLAL